MGSPLGTAQRRKRQLLSGSREASWRRCLELGLGGAGREQGQSLEKPGAFTCCFFIRHSFVEAPLRARPGAGSGDTVWCGNRC